MCEGSAYERDLKKMEPLQRAFLKMVSPTVRVDYYTRILVLRVADAAKRGSTSLDNKARFSPFAWPDDSLFKRFHSGLSAVREREAAELTALAEQRKRAKLVRGKRYARAAQALSNAVLRSLLKCYHRQRYVYVGKDVVR